MKELAYKRVKEFKELVSSDPNRLHYHIMPPVGFLNDPNGFVYFNDQFHMFFQWNPFETSHGAKFWGHYISDDLVHWKEAPIALAPDKWYDKNGCYSGSAVVHEEKLYLFYTGNVKNDEGNRETYQCLAISEDGIHFEKKGPVIYLPEGYTAHFRDPKVFFKNNQWYMVIGAQTKALKGEAVFFTSTDLTNWEFLGPIAGSGHNDLGDFGFMWECPDLFELHGKDILIISPQGLEPDGYKYNNIYQSGYFAGTLNYNHLTFDHGNFEELDRGFDFYAPQTTEDHNGRRILVGWMGNAEEKFEQPTVKHGWIHALTLPRELKWENGKLLQLPVEELKSLRENEIDHQDVMILNQDMKLPNVNGRVFELQVIVKEWDADDFSIQIGESSRIVYDKNSKVITFERKSLSDDGTVEKRHCLIDNLKDIQLFKDTSSVEIFINSGEEVFTSRVFDHVESDRISFSTSEGSIKVDVKKWDLKRVFPY